MSIKMRVTNPSLSPMMVEQELVKRARLGDEAAFASLVQIYQAPIFNLCYRMLGEAGAAEDAAQEALVRAYSQLNRYDPARPFKIWLFAIACHHCIDLLRRERKGSTGIADEPLPGQTMLPDPTPGPEEVALQNDQKAMVQALLKRLPPRDRSAIVMRYWYDLSYEEIADATGDTVSAVKSRLHRARLMLAGMLDASRLQQASI